MSCSWTQNLIDRVMRQIGEWEYFICQENVAIERELDKIKLLIKIIDKKLALPQYASCQEPQKGKPIPACWREVLRLRKFKTKLQKALACKCVTDKPPECIFDIGDRDTNYYCGRIRLAYKKIKEWQQRIRTLQERLLNRHSQGCENLDCYCSWGTVPTVIKGGKRLEFGSWTEYFQYLCRELQTKLATDRQKSGL